MRWKYRIKQVNDEYFVERSFFGIHWKAIDWSSGIIDYLQKCHIIYGSGFATFEDAENFANVYAIEGWKAFVVDKSDLKLIMPDIEITELGRLS